MAGNIVRHWNDFPTENTLLKFVREAMALKPAKDPLEDSTTEGKPVNSRERETMLKIIRALLTDFESKSGHILMDPREIEELVEKVGHSLPHNIVTKYFEEARALKLEKTADSQG